MAMSSGCSYGIHSLVIVGRFASLCRIVPCTDFQRAVKSNIFSQLQVIQSTHVYIYTYIIDIL